MATDTALDADLVEMFNAWYDEKIINKLNACGISEYDEHNEFKEWIDSWKKEQGLE